MERPFGVLDKPLAGRDCIVESGYSIADYVRLGLVGARAQGAARPSRSPFFVFPNLKRWSQTPPSSSIVGAALIA